MLNAYRGKWNDRVAIAPELWYYYPAKLLGVDMIEFQRNVPFHQAIKHAFEHVGCEGWGVAFAKPPNPHISNTATETWREDGILLVRTTTRTPHGTLTSASCLSRDEPSWVLERPIKNPARDLQAWKTAAFGGEPETLDTSPLVDAWKTVGETFLLEAWLGVPFFDFYASSREGGFETGILDFLEPDMQPVLEALQERYADRLVRLARIICERTPLESICIGCSWSCNSLLGPTLWRRWDKPVIQAVRDEVHRHNRLLHVHFHGRCLETVPDFAEIGIDCVCPFERPPGGDIEGLNGLTTVRKQLAGCTTMNGNVHTVETLIRGTPDDVRREIHEIMTAFEGNPRLILGTGDQVGRETPEENLEAMIECGKCLSPAWAAGSNAGP